MLDYIRDAAEIYRQSFATIRAEADLSRFPDDVARRRGAADPHLRAGRRRRARRLQRRRRRQGRTPRWPPARRCCAIVDGGRRHHPVAAARRQRGGVTGRRRPGRRAGRPAGHHPSAAAVDLWADRLGGAVRGRSATRRPRCSGCWNCSTRAPRRPAAVLGGPVGFVGSAESKQALIDRPARHVLPGGARPPRRQRDGRRRGQRDRERDRDDRRRGHALRASDSAPATRSW